MILPVVFTLVLIVAKSCGCSNSPLDHLISRDMKHAHNSYYGVSNEFRILDGDCVDSAMYMRLRAYVPQDSTSRFVAEILYDMTNSPTKEICKQEARANHYVGLLSHIFGGVRVLESKEEPAHDQKLLTCMKQIGGKYFAACAEILEFPDFVYDEYLMDAVFGQGKKGILGDPEALYHQAKSINLLDASSFDALKMAEMAELFKALDKIESPSSRLVEFLEKSCSFFEFQQRDRFNIFILAQVLNPGEDILDVRSKKLGEYHRICLSYTNHNLKKEIVKTIERAFEKPKKRWFNKSK